MAKIIQFLDQYFGLFLIAGMTIGMINPAYSNMLMPLLEPALMLMLFMVFLKTDVAQILQKMRNYRQVLFFTFMYMVAIPVFFYLTTLPFDRETAIGLMLLTAMPAGAASPALTDIARGNTALSASIVITTSLIAPITVPLLFRLLNISDLSVNYWLVFRDLAMLIFIPMLASQVIKHCCPSFIIKSSHLFTSLNVLLLAVMVYAIIGSQRETILNDPIAILWQTGLLYIVFILLHVMGYLIGFKEDRKGKIATAVSAAYMNNAMAIVLAALYFPSVLVLMVLSEIPWNTLLMPFRKIMNHQPGPHS